jgi:putative membrane protein
MVITTLAVFVAEKIVDGVTARNWEGLIAASLLLGGFNAVLRPLMLLLTLPLLFLTLGLFTFVINATLIYFVGFLLRPDYFVVQDFWSAFKAAIVISIVSLIANMMIGKKEGRVQVRAQRGSGVPPQQAPPPPPKRDLGSGPVIDV